MLLRWARYVSILTRPEGRVQPARRWARPHAAAVSILTRPEGRVQPSSCAARGCPPNSFNPHPSRRTGATTYLPQWSPSGAVFQSSPVPEDGCNEKAQPLAARLREFQSSPVPEDGCNQMGAGFGSGRQTCFNPHPSRRTGATVQRVARIMNVPAVSILTRPGGRVQPSCSMCA